MADSLHGMADWFQEVCSIHANKWNDHHKRIVIVANEVSRADWAWARATELNVNEDVCADATMRIGAHAETLSSVLEKDPITMAATLSEVCQGLSN